MGFWSSVVDSVTSFFGGSSNRGSSSYSSNSSTTTTREPDKVKVEEIKAQSKLDVANLKIKLKELEMKEQSQQNQFELQKMREELAIKEKEQAFAILFEEAQTKEQKLRYEIELDKMRAVKELEMAIMNQQMEAFVKTKKAMIELKTLFEKSSLDTVAYAGALSQDLRERINNYYNELIEDLENKNKDFAEIRLPTLLDNLSKYDENSTQFKIYHNMIDIESQKYIEMIYKRIEKFEEQQKEAIDSSKELEKILLASSVKMIENSMKMLDTQITQISKGEIIDIDIEQIENKAKELLTFRESK